MLTHLPDGTGKNNIEKIYVSDGKYFVLTTNDNVYEVSADLYNTLLTDTLSDSTLCFLPSGLNKLALQKYYKRGNQWYTTSVNNNTYKITEAEANLLAISEIGGSGSGSSIPTTLTSLDPRTTITGSGTYNVTIDTRGISGGSSTGGNVNIDVTGYQYQMQANIYDVNNSSHFLISSNGTDHTYYNQIQDQQGITYQWMGVDDVWVNNAIGTSISNYALPKSAISVTTGSDSIVRLNDVTNDNQATLRLESDGAWLHYGNLDSPASYDIDLASKDYVQSSISSISGGGDTVQSLNYDSSTQYLTLTTNQNEFHTLIPTGSSISGDYQPQNINGTSTSGENISFTQISFNSDGDIWNESINGMSSASVGWAFTYTPGYDIIPAGYYWHAYSFDTDNELLGVYVGSSVLGLLTFNGTDLSGMTVSDSSVNIYYDEAIINLSSTGIKLSDEEEGLFIGKESMEIDGDYFKLKVGGQQVLEVDMNGDSLTFNAPGNLPSIICTPTASYVTYQNQQNVLGLTVASSAASIKSNGHLVQVSSGGCFADGVLIDSPCSLSYDSSTSTLTLNTANNSYSTTIVAGGSGQPTNVSSLDDNILVSQSSYNVSLQLDDKLTGITSINQLANGNGINLPTGAVIIGGNNAQIETIDNSGIHIAYNGTINNTISMLSTGTTISSDQITIGNSSSLITVSPTEVGISSADGLTSIDGHIVLPFTFDSMNDTYDWARSTSFGIDFGGCYLFQTGKTNFLDDELVTKTYVDSSISEVAAPTYYRHNFNVTADSTGIVTFSITNTSGSAPTADQLATYIYNAGCIDSTHLWPASGVVNNHTETVYGIYCSDGLPTHLYAKSYAGTTYSLSAAAAQDLIVQVDLGWS